MTEVVSQPPWWRVALGFLIAPLVPAIALALVSGPVYAAELECPDNSNTTKPGENTRPGVHLAWPDMPAELRDLLLAEQGRCGTLSPTRQLEIVIQWLRVNGASDE